MCLGLSAADLQPANACNRQMKYADDTYLVVPASAPYSVENELVRIKTWSMENNLQLNQAKSQEIILAARRKRPSQPDPVQGIKQVESLKVFGVHVCSNQAAYKHVTKTIATCLQSLYAIKILKSHGLAGQALHAVFQATTLAKLMYGTQAWSGFCLASGRDRLDSFLRRCNSLGYCDPETPSSSELFRQADERLLRCVKANEKHVLHQLLPPKIEHGHNLQHRNHDFDLMIKTSSLTESNFIVTTAYNDSF